MENLELWSSVEKTDPEFTKKVTQRGGFTAVCAQYQLRNATEQWGPYGETWGVRDTNYGYVYGREEDSGLPPPGVVLPVEIWLEAVFWFPGGEFPISTDTKYKAGDDCRKKLLTDLTTKALSKLGFNADVFEGKFDDNKYVQDRKRELSSTKKKAATPTVTPASTRMLAESSLAIWRLTVYP